MVQYTRFFCLSVYVIRFVVHLISILSIKVIIWRGFLNGVFNIVLFLYLRLLNILYNQIDIIIEERSYETRTKIWDKFSLGIFMG